MENFLTEIVEVATSVIGAVTAGMTDIATTAIANPIIQFAVGAGLMFVGIRYIPTLIKSLRK